jgi:uncharacterized RDD family membrane protein YckC
MSWQRPEGEPPPESATPPSGTDVPEPDAETARVPVGDVPSVEAAPLSPEPPAPPSGLISARPVGWIDPARDSSGTKPAGDGPLVAWAAPAAQVAVPVTEGLVIAGVFTRLVAYSADLLILGSINLIATGLLGLYVAGRDDALALVLSGVLIGVDFLYFVGLWTSGWQATLGMRLLRLRILGAATARTLSVNDALLRWLALSGAASILTLVPGIGPYVGLVSFLWILVLLISTGTNPLHQGLHDRWARSVVVQPAPGGSGLALATCLVLVVLVGLLLPIAVLAVAGDQVRLILSQIGESI